MDERWELTALLTIVSEGKIDTLGSHIVQEYDKYVIAYAVPTGIPPLGG